MPEKPSASYRANEAREREEATTSTLDHVTALHLRAADKWGELAARAEKSERRAAERSGV